MKPEKHETISFPRFVDRDEKATNREDMSKYAAIHGHSHHGQELGHSYGHGELQQLKQSIIHPSDLRPTDILCGRSSTAFNNVGNRKFRAIITANIERYIRAITRQDKGVVIHSVVKYIKDDVGARFLKRVKHGYIELTERKQREKVGHALRDLSVQMEEAKEPQQVKSAHIEQVARKADNETWARETSLYSRHTEEGERRPSSLSQRSSRVKGIGGDKNANPDEHESANFGSLISLLMESIDESDDDDSFEPLPLA